MNHKSMNKPNLFIVGAPKCGTTSMAHYLDKHPDIFVSKYKEPHFFNIDSNHRFSFSLKQYLLNFREAKKTDKYLVDASVWYLYSKVAVNEIKRFNANSKFIVMLRSPIDMFYSLHQQSLFSGIENVKSPLKAWNLQEDRIVGKNIPYGCKDSSFLLYRETCKLGSQVERLISNVGYENICFVLLDDLRINPDLCYKSVLSFLDLEYISLNEYEVVNEKKQKIFFWLSNFFSFINRIKMFFNITKGLGVANLIVKLNKTKAKDEYIEEFYSMKPLLLDAFKTDIQKLEKLINRDLYKWYNEK